MSQFVIRVEGEFAFIHRSPATNRCPVGSKRYREYLTKDLGEVRRFSTVAKAETHARRLRQPFKGTGLDRAVLEIVTIETVVGCVVLRVI